MNENINQDINTDSRNVYSSPIEKKVDSKVKGILSQYKNGIESIFEESKFEESDGNYFLIIFKCPNSFYQKYANFNNETLNQSLQIKLFSSVEKKLDFSSQKIFDEEYLNINLKENDNKYIIFLNKIFEKFFGNTIYLLEMLIESYFDLKKKREFEYEDFILLFCSIIKYYTSLDISFELTNPENYLMIYIFGNEDSYTKICGMLNYNLQINPIAISYEENDENLAKKAALSDSYLKNAELIEFDKKEPLLNSFKNINIENKQFEDYDVNNPIFWPPYFAYKEDKDDKFRRYEKNDDYHYSKENGIMDESDKKYFSKFRNIDRLRFIKRILNKIIKFSELKNIDIFEEMLFKRNNKAYFQKLKELSLNNIYNPFDYYRCAKSINTIRNYFGETVSYYFLFTDHYTRMLLFPSIFGCFIFISYFLWYKIPFITLFSNSIQIDYYECLLILNCILLTIWLTLFIKSWLQKEKLYNYIWGISSSEKEEKINEEFIPNAKEKLILGYYVPKEKEPYHTFKKYVSYAVLLGMILLVIFFIYSLFRLKARLINGDVWHDYKITFYIACINGIQIKVMNFIYYEIAIYLNNWENHFSLTEKNNSLSLKLILFDFMNSYSSLFYIAFIKPYNEGCINNNCPKELETTMYSIFFIYISVFIGEIIYLYIIYFYQKSKMLSLIKEEHIQSQSLEHQIIIPPTLNLNIEYSDIINQFGFVCFFSIAAPLTPLIIFVLSLFFRILNYYKFVHLKRIEILDASKGISFYNKIIKMFLFIGVMINVAIFMFSSPNPSVPLNTIETLKNKFLTIFIIENSVIIIYAFVDRNILPNWFKYLNIIKDLYLNKYFDKDNKTK